MACNQSDVGNDGDNSLAVVLYQRIANNTIAQSKIDGVFPFNKLPAELQNKIIGYSMSATNHEISFSCLTRAQYKPNVAVGLLLVNHRIYHEAHYQLRMQNTFIFNHFGSDLKTIASGIGPLKCRSGACGHGPLRSTLAGMVFDLGDWESNKYADDKLHAFGCALRYLRSEITVKSLHIRLAYHSFRVSAQLSDFASGLSKIKVQEEFTIEGDESILDFKSFGDFPSKLGMDMMPVYTDWRPYYPNIQYSLGSFVYRYLPAKRFGESTDLQHKYLDFDPTSLSEALKAIGAQLDG